MTADAANTASVLPDRDDLVRRLAREVLQSTDEPYFELESALNYLVCVIQGLPCSDDRLDWAQTVSEALSLRPQHG